MTGEEDYSQLHPRLLYAKAGGAPDGDAYTLPAVPRPEAKTAWQILINSGGPRSAVLALVKEAREDNLRDPEGRPYSQARAKFVLEALCRRHEFISEWFFKGAGLELQFVDAQLLIRVLTRLNAAGIVGLPIHDSVIVKAQALCRLREIMDEELEITLRRLRR